MTTFIYYFIPEDNENENKMNIFIIYKNYKDNYKDIRLQDIKDNFPLKGEYYFRFKFEFMEKNVWIDFNNPVGALPKYDDKIIMKVTRLSEENKPIDKSPEFPF